MKINLKRLLLLSCPLIGSPGMAGSSSGTGPPSLEALAETLLSQDLGAGAGLFLNKAGDLNLGINRSLDSDLVLSRSKSATNALTISESDFESLSGSKNRNIDAVTIGVLEAEARSYMVEDGDKPGELILKDRRERGRNSVK
jgi:hypothetical protein